MTEDLTQQARGAINAGYHLVQALTAALPEAGREKLAMLTMAGAAVALTVRWIDGRAELRVGVTMDDGQPETILALDFGAAATSH